MTGTAPSDKFDRPRFIGKKTTRRPSVEFFVEDVIGMAALLSGLAGARTSCHPTRTVALPSLPGNAFAVRRGAALGLPSRP